MSYQVPAHQVKFTSRYLMQKVYIEGILYCIDEENLRLIDFYVPDKGYDFFTDLQELYDFVEWASDMSMEDLVNHVYSYDSNSHWSNNSNWKPKPLPPPIPLEEKLKHEIFRYENWVVFKLPHEEDFIQREGISMKHCLSVAQVDYCKRMKAGEIDVYSLTNLDDGEPVVSIEVAYTKSSYGGPVVRPTVTQLRGHCNQCPPKDEYLIPLFEFFKTQNWKVAGHGVKSFDRKTDGNEFINRYQQLYHPKSNEPVITTWAKKLKRRLWSFGGV